ncbi:MAG: succinyldiaminopimelate transaminase [Bifidobacteriaceae bacterium]|jgi:succinyldiaminopimelate transaminase|nr:succinyldiaminopimelate transaminase [Bifidobacteriaceae bacterium]
MGFDLAALPAFPWDLLEPHRLQAQAHPGGLIDLSVGSPVDPVPAPVQEGLRTASDTPGYPPTQGTVALREAIAAHYARERGAPGVPLDGILPSIGSKEAVALLPSLLGLGPGDAVAHPEAAYPTYDAGARLAGATPVPADSPEDVPAGVAERVKLVWLNSPGNPTGRVLGAERMAAWVDWARARGAVVASDECYAALAWEEPWASGGVPSLLDPRVSGGTLDHLVALYSVSKQSNAAGYRAAWMAGDPAVLRPVLELRKHMGLMMPAPVQAALAAALGDREHVAAQRRVYGRRRALLLDAVQGAGYVVEGSEAGLYLWFRAPDGQDGWATVADLASLGILTAPGAFYGEAARPFARMALTCSDAAAAEAAARLAGA